MLSQISDLILLLTKWYIDTAVKSWKHEIRRYRKRRKKWLRISLCTFLTIILLYGLTSMAFADSFVFGLSFIYSTIIAISFAYILRIPGLLILIYVGALLGREATKILGVAWEEINRGNILGAVILVFLGTYLIVWANRMKKGEI